MNDPHAQYQQAVYTAELAWRKYAEAVHYDLDDRMRLLREALAADSATATAYRAYQHSHDF